MRATLRFRNVEPYQSTKNRALEKLERLDNYLRGSVDADITFSTERYKKRIDIRVIGNGKNYYGKETSRHMFETIDTAVEKIELQLKKTKKRIHL